MDDVVFPNVDDPDGGDSLDEGDVGEVDKSEGGGEYGCSNTNRSLDLGRTSVSFPSLSGLDKGRTEKRLTGSERRK